MVQYRLSKTGTELLNDIKGGVNDIYNRAKNDKLLTKKLDKTYEGLETSIRLLFGCVGKEDSDKLLDGFISIFSKSVLLAYLQKFDNDRDLNTLKSQYTISDEEAREKYVADLKSKGVEITKEVLEGEIPEQYKEVTIDTDFRFGFQGLAEIVTASVEILRSKVVDEQVVSDSLASNLLTVVRDDITPEQYLTGGYMEKDIQLIALFGDAPAQNMSKEILTFIENDNNYYSVYTSALNSILGVYKYLLQDSFGLRPYIGVLSFRSSCCKVITKSYRLGRQLGSETVFKDIANKLSSVYKVNEMTSRQFNIKQIINSGSDVPMYFANKLLEYTMGRQLTYNLSEAVYRDYPNVNSWETYEAQYVEPQLKKLLIDAIYYSLEKNYKFEGVEKSEDKVFNSKAFGKLYAENSVAIKEKLTSPEIKSLVDIDMQRVMKSLCSGCVVTKYNNLKGVVNSIAIRIVDINNNLSLSNTKLLFDGCSSSPNIQYADGEVITEGRIGRDDTPIPYKVIEYQHDFNPTLSQAEPLFGYTAVDLFVNRGISISWDNILMGEDIKGTSLFAKLGDRDALPLQSNIVHNMIAGTRSGKGVMTMNILGSAIAEGKPIFYIDRKPDMAVLFTEISKGSMFVVNGNAHLDKNDAKGTFSDTGLGTIGWRTGYDNAPKYLKDAGILSKIPSYYKGHFADMVYYRAVLFTLSLLAARVELDGTEFYNILGGDGGIVVVIDEYLNWQSWFEVKQMGSDGFFSKNRLTKVDREVYEKAQDDIEDLELQASLPGIKPDTLAKIPGKIKGLQRKKLNAVTPLKVYCTTWMDKWEETAAHLSGLLQAGLKDKEGKRSDIFVIGQSVEKEPVEGGIVPGVYPKRENGAFMDNTGLRGRSVTRGVLNMLPHDWFMGRNAENPSYMGANSGGSGKKWIDKRGYWGYVNNADMSTLRTSAPSNTVYFKPYLVLNKHFEDDPKNPRKITVNEELVDDPDFAFVSQCRAKVNEASTGLWEKVRIKHLVTDEMKEDAMNGVDKHYGCLNAGIGFEGFASKIKQSNGKGEFSSSDLSLSGDIANYVAQRLGYSNYREFIYDLTPRGLFSSVDIVNAIREPSTYDDISERLPLFSKFNMMDNQSVDEVPIVGTDIEDDEEFEAGAGNLYEDEDDDFPTSQDSMSTNRESVSKGTDDGWTAVEEEDEEDNMVDLPEILIRTLCEKIITGKAEQRNKILTQEMIDEFTNSVIKILKEGAIE